MFNTLKYYKLFFVISGLILLFGIISLSVYHLKLGIDFTGGARMELQFKNSPNIGKIQDAARSQNLGNFQVQTAQDNTVVVETKSLSKDEHDKLLSGIKSGA